MNTVPTVYVVWLIGSIPSWCKCSLFNGPVSCITLPDYDMAACVAKVDDDDADDDSDESDDSSDDDDDEEDEEDTKPATTSAANKRKAPAPAASAAAKKAKAKEVHKTALSLLHVYGSLCCCLHDRIMWTSVLMPRHEHCGYYTMLTILVAGL